MTRFLGYNNIIKQAKICLFFGQVVPGYCVEQYSDFKLMNYFFHQLMHCPLNITVLFLSGICMNKVDNVDWN